MSALLDRAVRPVLTGDLAHHLVAHDDGVDDFFITTPFHVDEIEEVLGGRSPVVNVNVVPTSETLVRFARIPTGAAVSIIAMNEQTLERFVRMLRTYTRIEPIQAVLVDDRRAPLVAESAEVLIDSHAIHDRVMSWLRGMIVGSETSGRRSLTLTALLLG